MLLIGFPKRLRIVFSSLAVIFVMLFTGMSPSIMRAGVMVLCYNIAWFANRKPDPVTTLFTSGTLLSMADPGIVLDTGFILSFLATLGIAVCGKDITEIIAKKPKNSLTKFAANSFSVSIAAGIFIYPASIFLFDEISLASAISTIVFTPLIAIIMLSAIAATIFANIPIISVFSIFICDKTVIIAESIADFISNLDFLTVSTHYPFALATVFVFSVTAILFAFKNYPAIRLVTLSLLFLTVFVTAASLFSYCNRNEISVFSINSDKNDGFVFTEGNKSIYIDASSGASSQTSALYDVISANCSTELDVYLLTHYHTRHLSSLTDLNGKLPIRFLLMPLPETEDDILIAEMLMEKAEKLHIKSRYFDPHSEKLILGDFTFECLAPERTSGSTHPRFAFGVSFADQYLFYPGSYSQNCTYFAHAENIQNRATFIVLASHRPKGDIFNTSQIEGKVVGYFSEESVPEALRHFCVDLSRKTVRLYRERPH